MNSYPSPKVKKVPRKRAKKVVDPLNKAKEVADPLTKEDKEVFNPPNKYAQRAKVGDNLKGKLVTTVGLGGLVVTTNGRDHYRQH